MPLYKCHLCGKIAKKKDDLQKHLKRKIPCNSGPITLQEREDLNYRTPTLTFASGIAKEENIIIPTPAKEKNWLDTYEKSCAQEDTEEDTEDEECLFESIDGKIIYKKKIIELINIAPWASPEEKERIIKKAYNEHSLHHYLPTNEPLRRILVERYNKPFRKNSY